MRIHEVSGNPRGRLLKSVRAKPGAEDLPQFVCCVDNGKRFPEQRGPTRTIHILRVLDEPSR